MTNSTHFALMASLVASFLCATPTLADAACPDALNQSYQKLHSNETVNLCELTAGKAVLLVNTASHCGYTKQFSGLEKLHKQYQDKGLVVIGVPSNDFRQEASNEAQTAKVCYQNYGVSFTMLAPQKVKGSSASPLFKYLAEDHPAPRWNFNKYLLDRQAKVSDHFGSSTKPNSKKLLSSLTPLLK